MDRRDAYDGGHGMAPGELDDVWEEYDREESREQERRAALTPLERDQEDREAEERAARAKKKYGHFSDYGFPSNTELRPGHRTWDYG